MVRALRVMGTRWLELEADEAEEGRRLERTDPDTRQCDQQVGQAPKQHEAKQEAGASSIPKGADYKTIAR